MLAAVGIVEYIFDCFCIESIDAFSADHTCVYFFYDFLEWIWVKAGFFLEVLAEAELSLCCECPNIPAGNQTDSWQYKLRFNQKSLSSKTFQHKLKRSSGKAFVKSFLLQKLKY